MMTVLADLCVCALCVLCALVCGVMILVGVCAVAHYIPSTRATIKKIFQFFGLID